MKKIRRGEGAVGVSSRGQNVSRGVIRQAHSQEETGYKINRNVSNAHLTSSMRDSLMR